MSLISFESLSFYYLPLIRRVSYGGNMWEIWFPRPFNFFSGQICAINTGIAKKSRLYSIASEQNQDEVSFLYNEVERGEMTPFFTHCEIGTYFSISSPFGNFILGNEQATWIATGTGIAPFLSASRSNLDLSNKILIHGSRTSENFLGQEIFKCMLGSYIRCCSGCSEQVEAIYRGRLTTYLKTGNFNSFIMKGKVYLCGSSQMVVDVREVLVSQGLNLDNLICEVYF